MKLIHIKRLLSLLLTLLLAFSVFNCALPIFASAEEQIATPFAYVENGIVNIVPSEELSEGDYYECKLNNNQWTSCSDSFALVSSTSANVSVRVSNSEGAHSAAYSFNIQRTIGNYGDSFIDIVLGEKALLLDFSRFYSSLSGWSFSFFSSVSEISSSPSIYDMMTFDGDHEYFVYDDVQQSYLSKNEYTLTVNLDNNSNVEGYSVTCPNEMEIEYDSLGRLSSIAYKGYSNTIAWSSTAVVITSADNKNYTIQLNTDGQPTSVTTPTYTYTDEENISHQQNRNVVYNWNGNNLTSFTDSIGTVHNYTYSNGLLSSYDGITLSYTSDGRITRIMSADGSYVKYAYDDTFTPNEGYPGKLVQSDSKGNIHTCSYSDLFTDEEGEFTYDLQNLSTMIPSSSISSLCYMIDCEEEDDDEDEDEEYPPYEEFGDGYWFYDYTVPDNDGNRKIASQAFVPSENIPDETEPDDILYTQAVQLATEKYDYIYESYSSGRSETEVYSKGSAGNLERKYKKQYGYNANDKLTSLGSYSPVSDSGWFLESLEGYSYDACGRMSQLYIYKAYDYVEYEQNCTYTYNAFGELTESSIYENDLVYCIGSEKHIYDQLGRSVFDQSQVSSDFSGYANSNSPISRIYSSDNHTAHYTYTGNDLTMKTVDGEDTEYSYSNGQLVSETDSNNHTITYSYDNFGNLISKTALGYTLNYDIQGNLVSYYHGNTLLQSYSFDSDFNTTGTMYGNNTGLDYSYDTDGRLIEISQNNTVLYAYDYDDENDAVEIIDHVSDVSKVIDEDSFTVYNANETELYSVEETSSQRIESFGSDTYTRLQSGDDEVFSRTGGQSYTYHKNDCGQVNHTVVESVPGVYSTSIDIDTFDQLTSTRLNYNNHMKLYSYVYDVSGKIVKYNISSDRYNAEEPSVQYDYDSGDQLIRVNDPYAQTTTTYSYDDIGNIISKTEYAYTTGSLENLTAVQTYSYVYDSVFSDRLTSYNNQSITYDTIGNPLSYRGHTLTWTQGKRLASYDGICYTYNENGIRTSKTSNNVTTQYFLDDSDRLIGQSDGVNELHFRYSSEGDLVGLVWNGVDYFYIRNLVGDIVAILDASGNVVCEYTYDAWGKVLTVAGSNLTLANLNPFRYRSYYFDVDTGLYYLMSRYYDSEIERFLNTDDTSCIGKSALDFSFNAYNYCDNNPIINSDPYGSTAVEFRSGNQMDEYTEIFYGGDEYSYNSSKPSWLNKFMSSLWLLAAKAVKNKYPDGYEFYMHYRNGNGAPYLYDYKKAIEEDKNIREYVDQLIRDFHKFIRKQNLESGKTYMFTSKLSKDVGVSSPSTMNWKLAIGTHLIALSTETKKSNGWYNSKILIVAYDRYNFSSATRFAKVIPGSWNGQLVTCGLANNFTSYGFAYYEEKWR